MRFNPTLPALFMVVLTLAACSDSSSSYNNPAPRVIATQPESDATNALNSTLVTAEFDRDMRDSTIDVETFHLELNGVNVEATVKYDSGTNTATLTPKDSLLPLTTYTVRLDSIIESIQDYTLGSDYVWSFTTLAGAWGTVEIVDDNNTSNASAPDVAVDAAGNAMAVWQQLNGLATDIWANTYTAASNSWGTPVLIESSNAGNAVDPRIAVDAAGNFTAVWQQSNGTNTEVVANRHSGGAWSGDLVISSGASDASYPKLSSNAAGVVTVVWHQVVGASTGIFSNRFDGASWGGAVQVALDPTSGMNATFPKVAALANGDAVSVWQQFDGTRSNIWTARATAGTWGTPALLETNDIGNARSPEVAASTNGSLTAVWTQFDGLQYSVYASRHTSTEGWSEPETIENTTSGDALLAKVGMDANGNAIAVWHQSNLTNFDVWANRYAAGTGWDEKPLVLEKGTNGDAIDPRLAMNASGNALVVWRQNDGENFKVYGNRYVIDLGWGNAELVETNKLGNAQNPRISLNDNGQSTAVWDKFDGGYETIYSNHFQ